MKKLLLVFIFWGTTIFCFGQYNDSLAKSPPSGKEREWDSKLIVAFLSKLDSENILKKNEYDTLFFWIPAHQSTYWVYYYINGKPVPGNKPINEKILWNNSGYFILACNDIKSDSIFFHFCNPDWCTGRIILAKKNMKNPVIKSLYFKSPKHLDSLKNYYSGFRLDTSGKLGLRLRYAKTYFTGLIYGWQGLCKARVLELLGPPNDTITCMSSGFFSYKHPVKSLCYEYYAGEESRSWKDTIPDQGFSHSEGETYHLRIYFVNNKVYDTNDLPDIWANSAVW